MGKEIKPLEPIQVLLQWLTLFRYAPDWLDYIHPDERKKADMAAKQIEEILREKVPEEQKRWFKEMAYPHTQSRRR